MEKLRIFFIKDYLHLDYHTKLRANALLLLDLVALLLLVLQAAATLIVQGSEYYVKHSLTMALALAAVLIIGLFLMRKFSFKIAGSAIVTAFLVTHLSLLFSRDYETYEQILHFSGNLYISLATLTLSVLFSTRRMLWINSGIFLIALTALYLISSQNTETELQSIFTSSFILILTAIVVISLTLFFTMQFAHKAQEKTDSLLNSLKNQENKNTKLIQQVRELLNGQKSFAQDVADAVNHLSSSTSEQAADLEEISATMEEIDGSAEQNALQSDELKVFMKRTTASAQLSRQALQTAAQKTAGITEYIKVIEEIAFQTQLLSLNASIEATKAGQNGKGFTAVADAIRKLSRRSKEASDKIQLLIDENDKAGGRLKQKLEAIITDIEKGNQTISQIASAAVQQRSGIQQVSTSAAQVNKAAQTNASLAEQINRLQKKLLNDAEKIRQFIDEGTEIT